jgi:predicted Zn-dependent peptidase
MLKTFTLQNGMHIATYNLPNLKSIHLRISVKGGSLVEDRELNGVAHFMEHMLVQGIPTYPNVEEFSRFIEGLAGSYGAYTKNTTVSFYMTVPATHLEEAAKITSETFFEPLFVAEALEKERHAVYEEIKQRMDSHWYKISKFFTATRFSKKHPLTYDGGGSVETVAKITRDHLLAYWQQYFLPKNTYLLISGNFSEPKLVNLLNTYFNKHKVSKTFSGFPKMGNADFTPKQVAVRQDMQLKSSYIDLTFPSMELHTDLLDRVKQNLALVIFGQLRNSRLFKLLRYQKGLVYDVGAGSAQYPGIGYCYVSSQTSLENLDEVIELILQQLRSFATNGPTKEELDFAKNYLTNQWLMAFDHPSSISGWVEDHLLWDDKVLLPEDYAHLLKGISEEDIIQVIQSYWDFSKVNLVLQGPIKEPDEIQKKYLTLLTALHS